ncbi:MAG: GNAT family N-acetyltransferase [Candidatus Izemoplasma sp.]
MIWTKDNIKNLDNNTKLQWFDVYNYGLLEDRGYEPSILSDVELLEIKSNIKNDYLNYLNNLGNDPNFLFYYILESGYEFISVCRLIKDKDKVVVEGLETHRDYRKQGYGFEVIKATIDYAREINIKVLYAVVRQHNTASLRTFIKSGFELYDEDETNVYLIY